MRAVLPPLRRAAAGHLGARELPHPRGSGGRLDGHAPHHVRAARRRRVRERGDQPGGTDARRGLRAPAEGPRAGAAAARGLAVVADGVAHAQRHRGLPPAAGAGRAVQVRCGLRGEGLECR